MERERAPQESVKPGGANRRGLRVDPDPLWDDLQALGRIGAQPGGGVTRLAFTPDERAAQQWVAQRMVEYGLDVRVDGIGNVIGTCPGTGDGPPIAVGSHCDTVPNGGMFDGALGVVAALHCAKTLRDAGVSLKHPLEIICFAAEEGVYGQGTLGSRAMAGEWDPGVFDLPTPSGQTVAELMKAGGLQSQGVGSAAREPGALKAFLELHIEQGEVLERSGRTIGVVEGIVGIRRYEIVVPGRALHAGTTPMEHRDDAMVKAARLVIGIREMALALHREQPEGGLVATVGRLSLSPGSPAVIPGEATLTVDVRALDGDLLNEAEDGLRRLVAQVGATWDVLVQKPPVACDGALQSIVRAASDRLGLSRMDLPSGAGHDAAAMADLCPVGMIFVPSVEGVSHSPKEWTHRNDVIAGTEVLLETIIQLDEHLAVPNT